MSAPAHMVDAATGLPVSHIDHLTDGYALGDGYAEAVAEYTRGRCHVLAVALARAHGLGLAVVHRVDRPLPDGLVHVVAVDGGGTAYDIGGAKPLAEHAPGPLTASAVGEDEVLAWAEAGRFLAPFDEDDLARAEQDAADWLVEVTAGLARPGMGGPSFHEDEEKPMTLDEIAGWYADNLGAYEQMDEDPNDPAAVLRWVFGSGLCDDFAWAVHEITGWPTVRAVWTETFDRREYEEHHALVRAPDGRYLDAGGWIGPGELPARFPAGFRLVEVEPRPRWIGFEDMLDDGLIAEEDLVERLFAAVRALPYPPFDGAPFRKPDPAPAPGM